MPLGKKFRPSSATGKLETYHITSILSELRPATGKACPPRAKTSVPGTRHKQEHSQDESQRSESPPEWLERELMKEGYRRHSISLAHSAKTNEKAHHTRDPTRNLRKLKVEQRVSLENLKKLKVAFEDFEKNGRRSLDVVNFRRIVKKCLGLRDISNEQIQELFMKIDYTANGKIEWDDFCTYMHLEYTEKEESVTRKKQVSFALPATIRDIGHGEPILKVLSTPDSTVVTVRENGAINYWTPELKLKKSKMVFERPVNRKPKWVTDFVTMPQYNKLILGTGDREIQLYELSSLAAYCQVSALETVPLRLDYCSTGQDECLILYGDSQGCVNIIVMTSVGETLRRWKKLPKVENVPNIGIDNAVLSPHITYIRWKVHEDWVTQLKYYEGIRAVISTSNHESSALVIGCTFPTTNVEQQMREIEEGKGKRSQAYSGLPQQRANCDQTVFSIYKGVKTFDFCKKHNLIVTGGMDRIIRMWNPYVPGKPTGILKGHCAPIFYLYISTEENRIFSVSSDNTIKIWDIRDQSCLFTANPKASRIQGEVSACLFCPTVKALYVATDSIAFLPLRTKSQPQDHLTVSHKEPVLCCGYSKEFRQVVSCTEGSVVKVWDFDTGGQVFEFGDAHGHSAITCMTFDISGRRLVTGGRDGCLKIWNFNNGHCLKILKKEGKSDEVCDCTYVKVNRSNYVMAVGWDRRIDMYFDSNDDVHHIQNPQPYWQDDLRSGHKEDILCIAQCPPSLLATSGYDGEIVVWNMVSGHIHSRLVTPVPPECTDTKGIDKSVSSVTFLKTRIRNNESAACLVSSGPQGYVNFWSLVHGGNLFATFEASRMKCLITKMAVNAEETLLYVADLAGYIYVYDTKDYALKPEQEAPKTANYWRAHISSVTSLVIIDEDEVLLTSATDCTVRLWSIHGEFIGTFGQSEAWSIHTAASWKHPMIPYEILVDPFSMPAHQILEGESSVLEVLNSGQREENEEETKKSEPHFKHKFPPLSFSDKDIEEEINKTSYPQEHGKRLRHAIFKHANKPPNHGGPKAYHTLKYFEILDAPTTCEKPDLSAAGIDPFLSKYSEDESVDAQ